MAYERDWAAVPPQAFTANGGQWGLVTVADTAGFRVKQNAWLKNTANQTLPVQIKVVLSPTTLIVGYCDNQIANWPKLNISAWTVSAGTTIGAEWQPKSRITPEDIIRAAYEGDPVAAIRTFGVDEYGNPWSAANPLPVNADVTVNSVQLFTKPYDSIAASYPTPTTEIYKTYLGGLSGVLQQTVTVTYVDSTKNELVSVVRT
jgi:hypothetical protein